VCKLLLAENAQLNFAKNFSMKKGLPILALLAVAFAVWFTLFRKKEKTPRPPKDQPVTVSNYSEAFNSSVNTALNHYYELSEAFVTWDSSGVRQRTEALNQSLQGIKYDEIQKDTLIYQTAISYNQGLTTDLEGILSQSDITAKRQSFHSFSQNFYDLLRTVKFDGTKVFLQECPMAFNDTESGIWLSKEAAIRNPYLGTSHPKYKSGMLECGETKDSLNFVSVSK
jgi:hypothetical protein